MEICYKNWGQYKVLFEAKRIKLKTLHVNAHSELSLQSHEHRHEFWIVLNGKATVIIGSKKSKLVLEKGRALLIKKKKQHKLINLEDGCLTILEIQFGNQLSESDIVRY